MNNIYPSQKGWFAEELHKIMEKDDRVWLVVGDLGYKMVDLIFNDFPDRSINVGAAEQAGIGICVGLALEGKIPFFYSITNFTLYRAYEWIRNYIDYENIPVKLIGAGRDDEYKEDGYTHQSLDAKKVLGNFPNIKQYWPEEKEEIPEIVKEMVNNGKPCFLSLRRKK